MSSTTSTAVLRLCLVLAVVSLMYDVRPCEGRFLTRLSDLLRRRTTTTTSTSTTEAPVTTAQPLEVSSVRASTPKGTSVGEGRRAIDGPSCPKGMQKDESGKCRPYI